MRAGGSIDALSAKPTALEPPPAEAPLPPLDRTKAPAPERPKLIPIAKLAAQIDEMLAPADLTARRDVLVQPAVHVLAERVADGAIALGGTKIGGLPDPPAGTPWPEHHEDPVLREAEQARAHAAAPDAAGGSHRPARAPTVCHVRRHAGAYSHGATTE